MPGGSAVFEAANALLAKIRVAAGARLGYAAEQVELADGSASAPAGRSLAFAELAEPSRRDIAGVATTTGQEPVHLLVDSTGLKLCGPGEWLVEKHAARTRRSWRKLHIGVDADTDRSSPPS